MIIPPQQINIYVLPLKSGPVQVLRQQILPNLAIALARPVFELQKCYLDENCSEFNQEFIAVLRTKYLCGYRADTRRKINIPDQESQNLEQISGCKDYLTVETEGGKSDNSQILSYPN